MVCKIVCLVKLHLAQNLQNFYNSVVAEQCDLVCWFDVIAVGVFARQRQNRNVIVAICTSVPWYCWLGDKKGMSSVKKPVSVVHKDY